MKTRLCKNCELEYTGENPFCSLVCADDYMNDNTAFTLPCGRCEREVCVLYEVDDKMLCRDCAVKYEVAGKRLISHLVY